MNKLSIIVSSTRPGRIGPKVADWVAGQARALGDWEVELLDLTDLPFMDEEDMPRNGNYAKPHTQRWASQVFESDASVLVVTVGEPETLSALAPFGRLYVAVVPITKPALGAAAGQPVQPGGTESLPRM